MYMPVAFFSLCPSNSGAAVLVLCLLMMQVLLFFYFSWKFHLWPQSYLWMTSMAVVPSVPQPLLIACHGVHVLTECLCVHHPGLPFISPVLSCSLVVPCMTTLHWWLCIYLIFLCLCLSHGHALIANLQGIVVSQACTVFLCCTDGFLMLFFVTCGISFHHLS